MSVIKIERYRAVCDDCGALGDLRDSEALAVKHALQKQGWFGMATAYGFDRTMCATCARLRQVRKTVHEAEAKAAAFDAVRVEADGEVKGEAPWLPRMLDEALAKERARRGMP